MFNPIVNPYIAARKDVDPERGAGFAEYAFLLALVAVVAVVALGSFGLSVRDSFQATLNVWP